MDVQIDPETEYSPKQIAENEWIKNTHGKGDYYFVLKLIKRKLLKARDINPGGEVPAFRVKGEAILEYLKG